MQETSDMGPSTKADSDHQLAHKESTMRKSRAYQLEMLAEALRQNTIVAASNDTPFIQTHSKLAS